MKKWFNENKLRIAVSSLITLLPALFGIVMWDRLPDMMITHWGADGVADGFSGKASAVFVPVAIMFVLNLLCVIVTAFDQNGRNQNKKVMGIIFWIVPVISLLVNGAMYHVAFTGGVDFVWLFPALFGVLFLVMGNYMPKIMQNRTFGIKISWTLNNEENWNRTHRMAGKLWVVGGLVLVIAAFIPLKWMVCVLVADLLVMILVPFLYSYSIYRKHKKQGIVYSAPERTKAERIAVRISAVVVPLILVGTAIVMFTGSIRTELTEEALVIDATYSASTVVKLDSVDSVEYREDFDVGVRIYGFGSAKLSVGTFENDEFGSYTLYSYNRCDGHIVLTVQGKILAINTGSEADTRALYQELLDRIK